MSDADFDVMIVGAGPGGYTAAIRAAQRGLKVGLIEQREVGGVCLHAGCIPTKTLVASVALLRQARAAAALGLSIERVEATLPALNERRHRVVRQLTQGVNFLLEKNGVRVFRGRGRLTSATAIEVVNPAGQVTDLIETPRNVILATGSRPSEFALAVRDGMRILDSSDMLELQEAPPDLVIIGGGYIGCEFASLLAALGTQVTIIEALGRLLPAADRDLGQGLERAFKKAGIKVLVNAQVASVQIDSEVRVQLLEGQVFAGQKLLVCAGRTPNVEGLGLENAGVQLQGRAIGINAAMQTNIPNFYAIGDVTGKMALAHVANAQGRHVIERLAAQLQSGVPEPEAVPLNYDAIPACVFTHPEVAMVGLSEEMAQQRGLEIRVSRFPFAASGKALAAGATEGLVKLVADAKTGQLLGGHILGEHAAELIGPVALAMQWGVDARQLAATVFAHPTLSEAVLEAAEGLFGQPVHLATRRL